MYDYGQFVQTQPATVLGICEFFCRFTVIGKIDDGIVVASAEFDFGVGRAMQDINEIFIIRDILSVYGGFQFFPPNLAMPFILEVDIFIGGKPQPLAGSRFRIPHNLVHLLIGHVLRTKRGCHFFQFTTGN